MNLRNTVGIVLLVCAAGASYWWSRPPPPEPTARRGGGDDLPGYYINGAGFTATDEQGRVALQINAKSLGELPGEETLSLDGVHIDYTPADQVPWSMSASHATAPKDRSHVDLDGDVEIRSSPSDGSKPMQISTAALHFVPRESQATTDGAVEIRVGDWHLKGVGLRALLNANKWELESDVHGRFIKTLIVVPALAVSAALAAQGKGDCGEALTVDSGPFSFDGGTTHFVRPIIKQCTLKIEAEEAFSSSIEFEERSEWTFKGKVRITTEGESMEADSAVFVFEKNQLSRGELLGAPASFSASRLEAGKEPVRGSANKIAFDNVAQTLRLSEHVVVTRDRVRFQGCDIIYELKNEGVQAGDEGCGAEKYNIRVLPKPQADASPAAPP